MIESKTKRRLDETIAEAEEDLKEAKAELRQWNSWREKYEANNDLNFWHYQVATTEQDMVVLMNKLTDLRGVREALA